MEPKFTYSNYNTNFKTEKDYQVDYNSESGKCYSNRITSDSTKVSLKSPKYKQTLTTSTTEPVINMPSNRTFSEKITNKKLQFENLQKSLSQMRTYSSNNIIDTNSVFLENGT